MQSFINDEGRPFGIGFQEQVSNHLKLLVPKAVVVSVEEKVKLIHQVWIRKTNANESLLTRREQEPDIKTKAGRILWN